MYVLNIFEQHKINQLLINQLSGHAQIKEVIIYSLST